MGHSITSEMIENYRDYLIREEKSSRTIEKYIRDIRCFSAYLKKEPYFSKERVLEYKEYLQSQYKISSANSMLVALNRFFDYVGWSDCRVRQFKVQKTFFCKEERYLTQREYERLVKQAEKEGDIQLSLIMQTICSTGIRVGELRFVDINSLKKGYVTISSKGKIRTVFLPKPLIPLLKAFCREKRITAGPVFTASNGKAVDRSVIWRKMKQLCKGAKVDAKKVFPHNLRHLFSFTFYQMKKDLLRLAEILGHTSIETTRIYTATTGKEHVKLISGLGLVYSRTLEVAT